MPKISNIAIKFSRQMNEICFFSMTLTEKGMESSRKTFL